MIKKLEKLGFTHNESVIYSSLFELGESSTGPIIKRTDLHRNIVYETLDSLVKKMVVAETVKSNKKYFRVKDPEVLVDRERAQLKLAEDLMRKVRTGFKVVPHEVVVYEGREGWKEGWKVLMNQLKIGSTFYTIGMGGDKWVKLMGDLYLVYEKYAIENKVIGKIVAYEYQRQEIEAHQGGPVRDIRYLSEDNDTPVNFEILNDRVFIQIYDEPATIIEIRSVSVARGYRQYFESLWKVAKK